MNVDVEFTTRLRAWRRDAGLTQEDAAERCGLAVRTFRNLERGQTLPRTSTVELLIHGLDLGPDQAVWLRRAVAPGRPVAEPPEPGWVTPRQLPARVRPFVGRRSELRWLDAASRDDPATPVLLISGAAGAGKTALAVQWAHDREDRFAHGTLYLDLRGFGPDRPTDPGEAVARLLTQIGQPATRGATDDLVAAWRTALAQRSVLLILDNAGSSAQVRPLLPVGSASCVVVTSRDAMPGLVAHDGAVRLELGVLPTADSIELLSSLIGPAARRARPVVRRLAETCGRLPLALRIAAEVASREADGGLADLVERLDREPLAALEYPGDPHIGLRAVLTSSYRRLPARTQRAFRLLGVHPTPTIDLPAAAALLDQRIDQASAHLRALAAAHMAESVDGQRVVVHDLVHAFARELSGQLARERHAAFARLVDHLVPAARAAVDAADAPAGQWLDLRRSLLVHLAAESAGNGRPDAAVDLAEILGEHLETIAAYADAIALHGPAADAATTLGHTAAAAESWRRAGVALYRLGQPDRARSTLDSAVDAFRTAGDRVGEARTLMNLGSVRWRSGDLSEALARYRAALGLYRAEGDHAGTANVLCNIGLIHVNAGDVDLGVRHYEEALSLYRRSGARRYEAITLGNLGAAHLKKANLESARQAHAASARLAHAVGDRATEGIAFHNLGEVDLHLGRDRDARRHFLEALAVAREVGDRLGEGLTLDYLGVLHRRGGDLPRAAGMHERALAIARETANRDGQCAALTNQARVALEQGRYDKVRAFTSEAAGIAGQLQSPERLGQALNVVADLCEADGSVVGALASRRRALACARRAQAVMDEAAALDGLAGHHAARGRTKLAARHRRGVDAIRGAASR